MAQAGVPAPSQENGAAPPDVAGPGVARLSFVGGDVSVKRGDASDAVAAAMNAPLLVGDALATGPAARAEVQFDIASRVRLASEVEIRLADLQPGHFRMELAHGTVSLSVLRDTRAQAEISTPNVSMRPTQRGLYRITVGDDGVTMITVRYGQAEIYTQRGTEKLDQGQTMMVRGSADDPEFQVVAAIQQDEWDTWNEQRDRSLSNINSYKYLNPEIPGGEELDANGTWVNDPAYGEVWSPRVDPDWAPYREGRWAWEDYYGWTWVSTDPWGWAPYHYGNWYYGSAGWCWYPGVFARPVFWRPALVAFFGFGGFGVGLGFGGWGSVGWLPLAPFEAFHPWYGRGFGAGFGRGYYAANNFRLTNVNITNMYRNARVNGAMSGVGANAFSSGHFSSIGRVSTEQVRNAGLVRGALPIAPTANNLRYSDRAPGAVTHSFANSRFAGSSPAAGRVPFNQQRQAIQQSTSSAAASGWGRFGSPSRAGVASSPAGGQYRSSAGSQSAPGWSRFGTPNQSPRANYAGSAAYGSGGYPHFNNAQVNAGRSFGQPGGFAQSGAYGQGSSQALRISPSIVYNRTSQGYNRTYQPSGAPAERTYSAPRSTGASHAAAPSGGHAAPAGHSGGGGSHSSGGSHR